MLPEFTRAALAVVLSFSLCILGFGAGAVRPPAGRPRSLRPALRSAQAVNGPGLRREAAAGAQPGHGLASLEPPEATVLPSPFAPAPPAPSARPVRGVYATAYSTGAKKKFDEIIAFIRRTEVNALVIDVKDDSGTISYPSGIPLARAIGSGRAKFQPDTVMAVLAREGIYPIARIVAFKDPYLAAKRTDLAVRSKAGGLWRDRRGQLWVDPHNREVWRYVVDVAKEAARKGFREIQFDYVRFTSDGNLSDCVYPFATGQRKSDVIRDFLIYASRELKPLGVDVSADIFGLACSAQGDLGIGQRIEQIATAVDIVSPMVYPSHYYRGTYGIPDPDLAPYETILTSLKAALPRIAGLGVRLRPWLQDFSLRNKYNRPQLMAQIKAVYDAGLTEWMFWNPSNSYDAAKYNPE
ncbi:MAG: putative glycoside hydrolase [Patescibacteria group bacterium]